MPVELLDDIIEELADELGFYGCHIEDHPDGQCECRCCWTSDLRGRILRAVEVGRRLDEPAPVSGDRVGKEGGEGV